MKNNFKIINLKLTLLVFYLFYNSLSFKCQVANLVNNGSFEAALSTASINPYDAAKYWGPIDTNNSASRLFSKILNTAPYGFGGFQYPKSGNNYLGSFFYCDQSTCPEYTRWYPRNRLKHILKPGTKYCAKYYVVNTNNCIVGIDSYGIYIGGNDLDTIKKCTIPLTYLNPQIQNQAGIISDTLNWIAITGTFVANGTEKYMVLGNFKTNAATNTLIINPTFLPQLGTDVLIDDVSLIEVNLPAYAGPDKSIKPGDSTYIGRELDFAIDPGCTWFKLPNMTTAIDTISGLWVKPTTTSTYVVRQILDCSSEKWDTVVVTMNLVGIAELQMTIDRMKVFPIPSNNVLNIQCELLENNESLNIQIMNTLGKIIREEDVVFINKEAHIATNELPDGIYTLLVNKKGSGTISKRFVVSH